METTEPIRLDVGCGETPQPGYIGIDRKGGGEAFPLRYNDGTPVGQGSVDEIRASHCLEHFGYREAGDVLAGWVQALKPGGTLKVAVPDFQWVCDRFQARERDNFLGIVCGSQLDGNGYHKAIWWHDQLEHAMEQAGLVDIQPWESDAEDCSALECSLNLQGRKPLPGEAQPANPYAWLQAHADHGGVTGLLGAVFAEIGTATKVYDAYGHTVVDPWPDGWQLYCRSTDEGPDCCIINTGCANGPYGFLSGLRSQFPRVLLIAFDPDAEPGFIPGEGNDAPAGMDATARLARSKGYAPICAVDHLLLCVLAGLAPKLRRGDAAPAIPDLSGEVVAVMTAPRLGFIDHSFCAMQALVPLRISLERTGGVFWTQGMTDALERHLNDGTKYLLTLDYDTVFTRDDVLELYRLMEAHPEVDALCAMQMHRENECVLFTVKDGSNTMPEPGRTHVTGEQMAQDVLPVHSGHFGLTLIRTAALRRLWGRQEAEETPEPDKAQWVRWWQWHLLRGIKTLRQGGAKLPWFWHQPGPDGRWQDGHIDADIFFWARWAEAGNTLYLANRVAIGHLQLVVTWPGQTLKPHHQFLSEWHAHGKPGEAWR